MAFINVDKVGKKLGSKWILKGVSFGVEKGEIVTVLGSSGSGKSTLLRCMNRLTEINTGTISVNGKDIRTFHPPKLRRAVSMVFQFPAIFPGTVKYNIEYGLKLWGIKPKAQGTQALLDAGLDESYLKRNAQKLSGGEQQRVCLARSLAIGPKALLLDEPTASIDIKAVKKIEATIKELQKKRSLPIIWVTHDVEQAKRIADKVVILKEGRVTEEKSTNEINWGELVE